MKLNILPYLFYWNLKIKQKSQFLKQHNRDFINNNIIQNNLILIILIPSLKIDP